jgi:hypothetical protein
MMLDVGTIDRVTVLLENSSDLGAVDLSLID